MDVVELLWMVACVWAVSRAVARLVSGARCRAGVRDRLDGLRVVVEAEAVLPAAREKYLPLYETPAGDAAGEWMETT